MRQTEQHLRIWQRIRVQIVNLKQKTHQLRENLPDLMKTVMIMNQKIQQRMRVHTPEE